MSPKEILLKATKGQKDCSSAGCPIYNVRQNDKQLNEMYYYLTGRLKSGDNILSYCSECFLQICYNYNKERVKELFRKYVYYYGGTNFYSEMPCGLLEEMAKFMIVERTIDIE